MLEFINYDVFIFLQIVFTLRNGYVVFCGISSGSSLFAKKVYGSSV